MRPVLYPEAEQHLLFLKSRKGFDEEVLDRLSKYKRINFTVIITNSFFYDRTEKTNWCRRERQKSEVTSVLVLRLLDPLLKKQKKNRFDVRVVVNLDTKVREVQSASIIDWQSNSVWMNTLMVISNITRYLYLWTAYWRLTFIQEASNNIFWMSHPSYKKLYSRPGYS